MSYNHLFISTLDLNLFLNILKRLLNCPFFDVLDLGGFEINSIFESYINQNFN